MNCWLRILRTVLAVAFGFASAFFCYYSVRLAYLNVAGLVPADRRTSGMLIGAVAFPVAAILFGWLALRLYPRSR